MCRIRWVVVLVLGLAFGFVSLSRAAEFTATVRSDVMVAMRDGTKLATDLYLPPRDGRVLDERLPVILTRTPYGKAGSKSHGQYFARHGYVFVAQDTRGRYGSEGVWHWLTDDGPDGTDCAAWIAQQPWSDGKIGMVGTSYVGGTQHAMAMEKVPQLVTVIPVDAVSNMGRQSMRNAGAFELRFWNWIFMNAGRGSRRSAGRCAERSPFPRTCCERPAASISAAGACVTCSRAGGPISHFLRRLLRRQAIGSPLISPNSLVSRLIV